MANGLGGIANRLLSTALSSSQQIPTIDVPRENNLFRDPGSQLRAQELSLTRRDQSVDASRREKARELGLLKKFPNASQAFNKIAILEQQKAESPELFRKRNGTAELDKLKQIVNSSIPGHRFLDAKLQNQQADLRAAQRASQRGIGGLDTKEDDKWLKDIWKPETEGLTDTNRKTFGAFSPTTQSIKSLRTKLGNLVVRGAKSFYVPRIMSILEKGFRTNVNEFVTAPQKSFTNSLMAKLKKIEASDDKKGVKAIKAIRLLIRNKDIQDNKKIPDLAATTIANQLVSKIPDRALENPEGDRDALRDELTLLLKESLKDRFANGAFLEQLKDAGEDAIEAGLNTVRNSGIDIQAAGNLLSFFQRGFGISEKGEVPSERMQPTMRETLNRSEGIRGLGPLTQEDALKAMRIGPDSAAYQWMLAELENEGSVPPTVTDALESNFPAAIKQARDFIESEMRARWIASKKHKLPTDSELVTRTGARDVRTAKAGFFTK